MGEILEIAAEPYAFELKPEQCGLLIIDMQRDFLEPGGFGEMLGNDVSQLRRTIEPNKRLLAAWRAVRGLRAVAVICFSIRPGQPCAGLVPAAGSNSGACLPGWLVKTPS